MRNQAALFFLAANFLFGQVSLTTQGSAYTQDFNTLASTGTSSAVPAGWAFLESGTNANSTYSAGTGSGNAGDTYSFGATNDAERAFGGLQSGTLIPTLGASFTNNTGAAITQLTITYTGEKWRLGAAGREDRLEFQYSLNATALNTGTWTAVSQLNFVAPIQAGTVGALNGNLAANRSSISHTITGLNIPAGATFWIRWNDFNAVGADDGLAIDDFSLTPSSEGVTPCPTITLAPTALPAGTQNVSYSQNLSASGGNSPYSFAVTAGALPAGINLAGNTISGTSTASGTFNFTVTATDSTSPTACTGNQAYVLTIAPMVMLTNIHQIQGAGISSPLEGQVVTTEGIVTAVRTGAFWIQNDPADYDANPNTSEGLFVFVGGGVPAVSQGQRVRVTGTVAEFRPAGSPTTSPVTQLANPSLSFTVLSNNNPLPPPVALNSSMLTQNGGQEQLERYEGMRVSLPTMTVVSPTAGSVNEANATATTSGFFYVVFPGLPVPFREPGIQTPLPVPVCAAGTGCNIPVFDNNPERIEINSTRIVGTTALNVRVGQQVSDVVGPLDWAFGVYNVYPDGTVPPVVSGSGVPEGVVPAPKASEVTVATYNVERLFDTVDDPAKSDVVVTPSALANRLNKLSLAVRNNLRAPDIIALQEVENLGVLQQAAAKINADAGGAYTYTAYLAEGNDPGGIDTGYLVKDTVTVSSVVGDGLNATYTNPCTGSQEVLNDRLPLILRGTVTRNNRTLNLVVINNHLRSFSGVNDDSTCSNGTRVRAKRGAQAEYLANLVQAEQIANPGAKIIVLGDLNDYEFSDGYVDVVNTIRGIPPAPTQVARATQDLVNPDLSNLLDLIPDSTQRFSYLFDGNHQTIDHILFNQGLAQQVTNGSYGRLNAQFPAVDRNDSNSPRRLSDHDPGVIYLTTAEPISTGITYQRGGLLLNRTTNTFNGNLVVRNTGTATIAGPFSITITGLPNGVSLANAAGTTFQGAYVLNSSTSLAPGASLVVPLQFSNPGNLAITYTPLLYSGTF